MSNENNLVVVLTSGVNDERASVAFSVANAGIAMGLDVTLFLVSHGADWARKGAADVARLNPLDPPAKEMLSRIVDNGTIIVCPPCAQVRGYQPHDLIDGVELAGAAAMLGAATHGATTMTF